MMYTCISLIVHPPFEIPGSAPGCGKLNVNSKRQYTYIYL